MAAHRAVRMVLVVCGLTLGAWNQLSAQAALEPLPFTSYPFATLRQSLFQGVHLTPAQTDRAFAITKALLDKMHSENSVMAAASDSLKRARISEHAAEHATALRAVVTEPQRAAFDSNFTAWRQRQATARKP